MVWNWASTKRTGAVWTASVTTASPRGTFAGWDFGVILGIWKRSDDGTQNLNSRDWFMARVGAPGRSGRAAGREAEAQLDVETLAFMLEVHLSGQDLGKN